MATFRGIKTYSIESHGAVDMTLDWGSREKEKIVKLPNNVLVIMNCVCSPIIGTLANIQILTWLNYVDEIYMKVKYLESYPACDKYALLGQYINQVKNISMITSANKFCLYTEAAPLILFYPEYDNFKSGIFELPLQIPSQELANMEYVAKMQNTSLCSPELICNLKPSFLPLFNKTLANALIKQQFTEIHNLQIFVDSKTHESDFLHVVIINACTVKSTSNRPARIKVPAGVSPTERIPIEYYEIQSSDWTQPLKKIQLKHDGFNKEFEEAINTKFQERLSAPCPMEQGGSKKQYIHILGRKRIVHIINRKKHVRYKNVLIPLKEAKRLEKYKPYKD